MKKLLMLLVLMSVMMSLVSAGDTQPADFVDPKASDFTFDNNNFGEKPSIWNDISDFFSGLFNPQEFSFTSDSPDNLRDADVSDTSIFFSEYWDGALKSATDTYELVCKECPGDSFCQIVHYDINTGAYLGNLFGDMWYKSYPTDNVNIADSRYFTSTIAVKYGYKCWIPLYELNVYSCREFDDGGSVRVYKDGQVVLTVGTALCKKAEESVRGPSLTVAEMESKFVNRIDVCYRCSNGVLLTEAQDGCEAGWSLTKPTTCVQTVDCYKCDSDQGLLTKSFTTSCGTGYSLTKPTCIKCYACDGTDIINKYDDECIGVYTETRPDCSAPPTTTCYQCSNGQVAEQVVDGTTCPAQWSINAPNSCVTTCYTCEGTKVVAQQFADGCPVDYALVEPESCTVPLTSCFKCQDGNTGVVLSELQESCSAGWSEAAPSKEQCLAGGPNVIDKAIAYMKENAPESYIIGAAAIVILISLFVVSFGNKPKQKVAL